MMHFPLPVTEALVLGAIVHGLTGTVSNVHAPIGDYLFRQARAISEVHPLSFPLLIKPPGTPHRFVTGSLVNRIGHLPPPLVTEQPYTQESQHNLCRPQREAEGTRQHGTRGQFNNLYSAYCLLPSSARQVGTAFAAIELRYLCRCR